MKRYAGWFRALVVTIVCFLAFSGAVLPAAAADTTMTLELWFEVDGSGSGQLHVFIPAGNTDNIDDLVSGMSSEAALSGVVMTDLGGGNYQINFTWSSFFDAFDPNSWADNGDTVEGEFGALVQSFTEVILHLPGTVLQQQGGTKVDNFTLSFKGGSTATFSFSKNGVVPSPTPSPSSSPTASQETYDIELWINTDGSGRATVTAYLPPGGHTADEMVSSLQSEPTFTGVTQKSLGGDNYEITFKWSDFETAFDPGMWVVSGNNVDLDLGYLTETFAETTVHLPGTIISSSTGIWIDDFSIVFISGDNTEISIDLSVPPPPTPTSPATPKPTPTASPTPKPTPTSSPTPKPTPTATPTITPSPIPTDTPTPTSTNTPEPPKKAKKSKGNRGSYNYPGRPAGVDADERWIDVDLSLQRVYVYQGDQLANNFLVSTGTWLHPTVTGIYKIYVKYRSAAMTGPGYYLPDVPYIMYFYKGYGLHGTYWHHNFGTPMSHGCVNLRTSDAGWLYNFASVGTVVNVHQ